MNEREVGRKYIRNEAKKIRAGLCGMGKTETVNGVCVNRVIYSPNERT